MRVSTKEQLIEILNSMQIIHKEIKNKVGEQRNGLLEDCQQAAIAVGEAIEKDMPDDKNIVPQLETYCEEVFLLSQKEWVEDADISVLNEIIDYVKASLREISATYHVLFMPYKAAMWDSLESIWRVCKDDERCECVVMPLPYFEFNANKQEWEPCYEGKLFPADIPITNYQNYSIENEQPDIAYIHNPYDNYNRVTSVHPTFYSDKLKQHVRKLVYVPYYVTAGFISPEQMNLPVYRNVDYMVFQSEYAKISCKEMFYYDKILPFGSPKIDKVIHACQDDAVIPDEWRPIIQNKKVLMLNTSIGCFLHYGETYLDKIKCICNIIKNQDNIALIWRPHPLLEATIISMRPHLLQLYHDLIEFFQTNRIGVLDKTPDITNTVAISDGYIGEEGSSVINLFGAAGKPIFILDNMITDTFSEEEKRRIHIMDMAQIQDKVWFVTNRYNALFCMSTEEREVSFMGRVAQQPKWWSAYPFLSYMDKDIYLSPDWSGSPAVFHSDNQTFELMTEELEVNFRCRKIISFENKIFYLPARNNCIIEYNTDTKSWIQHTECIYELGYNAALPEAATFDYVIHKEYIWISATYTNRVLQFSMRDCTYSIHHIGGENHGYSGIAMDEGNLWLAEVHSGNIVRWNRYTKKLMEISMPDEFSMWRQDNVRDFAHLYLIDMGESIVTIPGFSNCMVKLDKKSGKATMLIQDFWKNVGKTVNGYIPEIYASSDFAKKINDSTIWVQRSYDEAVAIVNVEEEAYEVFYPALSEEDFSRLTDGEDGFEKLEKKNGFFRRESKIFSFQGFIKDLAEGNLEKVRERQLQELSSFAANLDGTCGIKVHEYMMKVLEKEVTKKI